MPRKYPPGYVKDARFRQVRTPSRPRFRSEQEAARAALNKVLSDLTEGQGEFMHAARDWCYASEQERVLLCKMAGYDFFAYTIQLSRHLTWMEDAEGLA